MKSLKTFLNEATDKASSDAKKVERALKLAGIDYTVDTSGIGFVSIEIEDVPGMKIVVDGIGISVTERGTEEFYETFGLSSLKKAIAMVEKN